MDNINLRAYTISLIIINLYKKIAISPNLNQKEYNIIIKKLEEYLPKEKKEYNKLTLSETNYLINEINKIDEDTLTIKRYRNKLLERRQQIEDNFLNSKAISIINILDNQITIETLKKVNTKIATLRKIGITDEHFIASIKRYHNSIKYLYLTSNTFLEELSLKHKYDIEEIPNIKVKYENKDLVPKIEEYENDRATDNIIDSMEVLDNTIFANPILNTYMSMIELSHIEVLLSKINNIAYVNEIITYCNHEYYKEDKDSIKIAKDKIKQRKKELDHH